MMHSLKAFFCYRSSDPNITDVDVLYDNNDDNGYLYKGKGAPPSCSYTSPPPSSGCQVCLDRFVHAVCSDLLKNVQLVMEGAGANIEITQSECPELLSDASASWPSWLIVLICVLLALMVIVSSVIFYKIRGRGRTPRDLRGAQREVDPGEEEPVADAAV